MIPVPNLLRKNEFYWLICFEYPTNLLILYIFKSTGSPMDIWLCHSVDIYLRLFQETFQRERHVGNYLRVCVFWLSPSMFSSNH